jgi:hypothetical protein
MRSMLILLACVAAAGCSSMRAPQVTGLLDPYVGQPVSALVDRFGPPSSSFASDTVSTTYQWDGFGAQAGMSGCRIMVMASRGSGSTEPGLTPFTTADVDPDDYRKWRIDSWSSLGTGCH